MTIGATVLLVGLLVAAVLTLGTSSESKFVTVGESIPSNGAASSGSASSGSSADAPVDDLPDAGLLLSADDLTDRFEVDPVLEASESEGPDSTRSFCDPETVPSAGSITERWSGDATWEIDLSVVVYESEAVARASIEKKQAPDFRECAATMYSAQGHVGQVQGEVVDQDQTSEGDDLTVSAAVDGSSSMGDTRMVVAYRLVGRATVSVRMFAATGAFGERRDAPTFDLDTADELTALVADRVE